MTLSETILFPQAMMPLFIFEPRYRQMLADVLENDRIFALATIDPNQDEAENLEIAYSVAGIGVIRACKKNPDGTSHLILQGIARVMFEAIVSEEPYRRARIRQIESEIGGDAARLSAIRPTLVNLVQTQRRLGAPIPDGVLEFLSTIEDAENVLDLAIYTLCGSGRFKQELLETRSVLERFGKFKIYLNHQIEQLKLDKFLKGGLDDDHLGSN